MTITLRQLEIFIAVVEEKQVTKASKRLFITQSAVSLALNELENHLGGPLFDRDSRSLLLNDRGRYLLPLAREILSKANNVWELMNERDDKISGSINIVASSTTGNYVLPFLISAFKKMYPDVFFSMQVFNTKRAEQLIEERKVDIGFVEGEVKNENILVQPWFQDELVIFAGSNFLPKGQDVFDLQKDMKRYPWVMREKGSGTAFIFKKKLGKYVTNLNVAMELGHTEAVKKAVEAGVGLGCLSNLAVCRKIEQGHLKKIHVEGLDMSRNLTVIQHKNKVSTNLMNKFVKFCSVMRQSEMEEGCLSSPQHFNAFVARFTDNLPG